MWLAHSLCQGLRAGQHCQVRVNRNCERRQGHRGSLLQMWQDCKCKGQVICISTRLRWVCLTSAVRAPVVSSRHMLRSQQGHNHFACCISLLYR